MRLRHATLVVLLAALAGPAASARPAYHVPHHKRIPAVIRRVARSHELWATVNICNTPHHPHTIGIRGQMPALGVRAQLTMDVQVDYWAGSHRGFVPDPGVHHVISLGAAKHGLHQTGYTFQFSPPAVLSGQITFEWRAGHRLLGRITRRTAHGVHHVDFSDPSGYSTATCRILS